MSVGNFSELQTCMQKWISDSLNVSTIGKQLWGKSGVCLLEMGFAISHGVKSSNKITKNKTVIHAIFAREIPELKT